MCKTEDGKIKVSIAESITKGSTEKTSATGLAGMILLFVALAIFIALIGFYFFNVGEVKNIIDLIDRCIAVITIGSTLLGVRKISGVLANNKLAKMVDASETAINENSN